jgi:hypothetical protein
MILSSSSLDRSRTTLSRKVIIRNMSVQDRQAHTRAHDNEGNNFREHKDIVVALRKEGNLSSEYC